MNAIERARGLLSGVRRLVVLSGAGLSAESGMATFRGAGGLWEGRRVEEVATPEGFQRDPALVWEWYSQRRGQALACRPHPGHEALVAWERRPEAHLVHVTQNVDGLLQRAGAERVLELHGSLFRVKCSAGCPGEREDLRVPFPHPQPCPRCGDLLRPAVVWFHEMLPAGILEEAAREIGLAEVLLVVGTSGVVQPAASLADIALGAAIPVLEVNPEETPLSSLADVFLKGPAGKVLPSLLDS